MYPTIYHLVLDLFGLEIPMLKIMNSFGFFVALAFISAAYFLKLELARKSNEGNIPVSYKKEKRGGLPSLHNIISTGFFGFVIGYKFIAILLDSENSLSDPQSFLLSTKGNALAGIAMSAIFLGLLYRAYLKEKKKYPNLVIEEVAITHKEHSWNMAVQAAIFGFAGAKLFHLIENPGQFIEFFTDFNFANFLSGLTIYGGLILGGAGVMWYMHRHKIPLLSGADAAVPGVMLAYGVGRIGCQVSGDGDWGIDNLASKPDWMSILPDWMWSYSYPNNINGVGEAITNGTCFDGYCTQLTNPVFPTPFYETTMAVTIFLILWSLRKKITIPGVLFFAYMIFNGFERFWIEKIRVNNVFLNIGELQMTQAEVIAVIMFIVGIGGILFLRNRSQLTSA
ncbi:MAG: phosphatidylglycerol:prolipoprotein diacylglycerol transferase [Patiriisocius sp.]|jgi:phosphatidylglycerol:prolipoprotein diacylglycerol transferase